MQVHSGLSQTTHIPTKPTVNHRPPAAGSAKPSSGTVVSISSMATMMSRATEMLDDVESVRDHAVLDGRETLANWSALTPTEIDAILDRMIGDL